MDYCQDWKHYLMNYDFYMVCIWVFLIAGIISRFWNFKGVHKINKNGKIIELEYDLMRSIQNISIGALIIRIFQVFYISKLYLGG